MYHITDSELLTYIVGFFGVMIWYELTQIRKHLHSIDTVQLNVAKKQFGES